MPLEILAPGDRPLRRGARDRPARARLDAVDQVHDQRERRQQRAILRAVRKQHRMVLLGAQRPFESGRHASKTSWASVVNRRNGNSSGVRSSAPSAALSQPRCWT